MPPKRNRTLAAIMFTDMVGYTALMQEDESLANRKRNRHREVLERTHAQYGGELLKYFGDGTLSIFQSVVDAVECAIDIQQNLRQGLAVPLRIGIHLGDILYNEDGAFGDGVNLASRIESFSVPGAVLVSETVYEQIRNQPHLPAVSLGQFQFKNVAQPTTIYALANDGLVIPDPGELQGKGHRQETPKHNLPQQLTSFIGREQEITEISDLVRQGKLVTITGPGGTGKTRLALKVAENLADSFSDGVTWIPLAAVSDQDSVKLTMIKALGLIQTPTKEPVDLLVDYLRDRELLLVLDNFEHILPAAAIVQSLLENCRRLKVFVTSRIILHLQMEQEYPLRPLPVPVLNGNNQVERLGAYPSMDLFFQRAKAVKPNFSLDDRNVVDVATICRRLDGLPLAIELAAARVKIFSPRNLLTRLDRHLDLLKAENPDRPERHYTLRHTISWSYQLLSEEERRLFNRLSVFSGGCYLEAIESVCAQDDLDELEIVDHLFALVSKSLINRKDDANGEPRFYLLETIRAFAREQLAGQEDPENIRGAHARYFVARAEEAQPHLTGPEQGYWFSLLEEDLDNYREALNWSIAQGHYELAFRLGIALWRLWLARDMLREGLKNAHELLGCPVAKSLLPLRAKIVGALIATYFHTADFPRALPLCEENLTFWQEMEDEKEIASTMNHLGFALIRLGKNEKGIDYTRQALDLYKKQEDLRGQAVSYNNFGWAYIESGEPRRALPNLEQSLQLRKRIKDERGIGFALVNLARAQTKLGLFREAKNSIEEGLNLLKKNKNQTIYLWGIIHLCMLYYKKNNTEKYIQLLENHKGSLSRDDIKTWGLGFFSYVYGFAAEHFGNVKEADRHILDGIRNFDRNGIPHLVANGWYYRSKLVRGIGQFAKAWDYLKSSLEINQRHNILLSLAENLELAGMLCASTEEFEKATLLLSYSRQMRSELGTPIPPVLEQDVRTAWIKLEEELYRNQLEELIEKGRAMSREEAMRLIETTP